jgi:hypothetical protein
VKFTALLVLLICIASPDLKAQDRQADDLLDTVDMGERRLHFGLGAGLQQGIYGAFLWSIPLSQDHHFVPEVTLGIRPGRWSVVVTAALGWRYLNIQKDIGSELKFKWSFENWKQDADEVHRRILGVTPGIVMRYGSSLITLSVGPGIAFTNTTTETAEKMQVIDRSELVFDLAAGITF